MNEVTKGEIKIKAESLASELKLYLTDKSTTYADYRDIIKPLLDNYRFNVIDYIDSEAEVAEHCFEYLSDYDKNNILSEQGYVSRYQLEEEIEDEIRKDMEAKDLNELQVNELLAQLKVKYDLIQTLEKALGARMVADLRGLPDPDPRPDHKNYDKNCYCSKVIGNEAYEIEGCCERLGIKANEQWVANNHEGDFVVMACDCGKLSKPYLKD